MTKSVLSNATTEGEGRNALIRYPRINVAALP